MMLFENTIETECEFVWKDRWFDNGMERRCVDW